MIKLRYLINKKQVNRLLLLFVTGFPGLYKIIILFLIKYKFSNEVLGQYVNDTSIATIFGFFTYVSLSNYVVKEIPILEKNQKREFLNTLIVWIIRYFLYSCLIILLLYYLDIIHDILGFLIFIISSSFYYVFRYYYIVEKSLTKLTFFEIIFLLISLLFIWISNTNTVLILNGLAFFVYFLILFFDLKLYKSSSKNTSFCNTINHKQILSYGFLNVTASGLYLSLAPISYHFLNPSYTALIGIITNITSVLLLFTRSISYHFSPILSINKSNISLLAKHQHKFKSTLNLMLFVGFFLCSVAIFILFFFKDGTVDLLRLDFSIAIVFLFILMITISQLSLPASSLFVIMNEERVMININLIQSIIFAIALGCLYFNTQIEDIHKFLFLLVVLVLTNLYRFYHFNIIENRILYYEGC